MVPDVVAATYRGDYKIELQFDDGKRGIIDFSTYLEKGGVFTFFEDMEFFKSFTVNEETGTLIWPNEIDVAPESLYSKATGSPLPSWMNS